MTLGNILLQPQMSTRFSEIDFDQSLMDDVISIVQKLSMNPELRESLLGQIEPHLESFIAELTTHIESNMTAAQTEMSDLVEGLIGAFSELTGGSRQLETVGDVLQFLLDLVDKFAAFIESLDIHKIKGWLSKVFDILFETLGFNSEFLQQKFCQLMDIVIAALETFPDGATTEHIEFQLQISSLLKRIKREVLKDIPDLDFNTDRLAQMLLDQLRDLGLDTIQEKAQCLAGKVRSLVDAGTSIYDLGKVIENDSVGAVRRIPNIRTGKKYCWYASWLYQTRRRAPEWKYFATYLFPMIPKDEVWISEDGKKLILRHATKPAPDVPGADEGDDELLYESPDGRDIKWFDAPQFSSTAYGEENFSFTNALSPEFLEDWTISMSALVYFAKMTGHIIHATEPGNHITHSILSAWNLTRLIGSATTLTPFSSWLRDKMGLGILNRMWMDMVMQWLPIILASFEGFHGSSANDRGKLWMTLIGDDAYDCFLMHLWPTLVHEGMLSIFTLINQKGPAYTDFKDDGKPRNHEYSFPLTNVWLVFFSWLQSRVALDRKDYSHPFESNHMRPFLLNWLLYSWMFGALAGITGELTGWALSRSVSPRRLLEQLGWGAYKGWGMYLVTHYFWNEGDTDGGRYNPTNAFADGPAFPGYPDPDTSPYRLPVAGGEPIFVGQAHQGMFSHFVDGTGTIQVYATDFAHDFQQMITAIRDGVVVDFDESQTDSNTTTWNYITIMHSNPNGTETAENLAHDIDQAGAPTPVTTYAVYGHGAQNGVSAAFNPRGVTTPNIIGTVVNRGDNIMQAGDTGVSFHNHLHLHVRTGPAPVSPVVAVTSGLSTYTIPIVFGDARHPLKGKGRLKFLTWYRSGNA